MDPRNRTITGHGTRGIGHETRVVREGCKNVRRSVSIIFIYYLLFITFLKILDFVIEE